MEETLMKRDGLQETRSDVKCEEPQSRFLWLTFATLLLVYRSKTITMTKPIPVDTDYPTLDLGHPHASCKDVSIVGLNVKIYGLEEIKHSSLPIAAVVREIC